LTVPGIFVGTPLFASPEQLRGERLDHRSDIFSLGTTLYTLLCGRPPFWGQNRVEVALRISSEAPVPVRQLRPEVSPSLERLVLRCLAKDRRERFQTYQDLRTALLWEQEPLVVPAGRAARLAAGGLDCVLLGTTFELLAWCLRLLHAPFVQGTLLDRQPNPWLHALWLLLVLTYVVPLEAFGGGASLGKRLLGVHVASTTPRRLAVLQHTLRSLLWGAAFLDHEIAFVAAPLGLSFLVLGGEHRGVFDRLTWTRVVRSVLPARPAVSRLDHLEAFEPIEAGALEGFEILGRLSNCPRAVLVARDLALSRRVWLVPAAQEAAQYSAAAGARRLELLRSVSNGDQKYLVYESPGGCSFSDALNGARACSWGEFLVTYQDLLELQGTGQDRDARRLWIDREARVRVLDFEVGEGSDPLTAFVLASWQSGLSHDRRRPQSSDGLLEELLRRRRREELSARLQEWVATSPLVVRSRRALSMLLSSTLAGLAILGLLFVEIDIERDIYRDWQIAWLLERTLEAEGTDNQPAMDREVLVSAAAAGWGQADRGYVEELLASTASASPEARQRLLDELEEVEDSTNPEQLELARRVAAEDQALGAFMRANFQPVVDEHGRFLPSRVLLWRGLSRGELDDADSVSEALGIVFTIGLFWQALVPSALAPAILGLGLRNLRNGRRAGSGLRVARYCLLWAPLLGVHVVTRFTASEVNLYSLAVLVVAAGFYLTHVVSALRSRSSSVLDRLLQAEFVPA
jgi:uncharacterized RDD family membrane protein YckC